MTVPQSFVRFLLIFERHPEDGYRVRLADSPAGSHSSRLCLDSLESLGWGAIPGSLVELGGLEMGSRAGSSHRHVRDYSLDEGDLKRIGTSLFEAVFDSVLRRALDSSRRRLDAGVGLSILLRFDSTPELADLPWEALYDPAEGIFLSAQTDVVLVRSLAVSGRRWVPRSQGSLRLLSLLPEPVGEEALSGRREWQAIQDQFVVEIDDDASSSVLRTQQEFGAIGTPSFEMVEPPTLAALGDRFRARPFDVLHVVAHGLPGGDGRGGRLSLEDGSGRSTLVTGDALAFALEQRSAPTLVVLNVCFGGSGPVHDAFDGLAQTLVRRGVASVVAMREGISDAAAVFFARVFYEQLAVGATLESSMVAARQQMANHHPDEWSTPLLYLSGENLRLIEAISSDRDQIQEARYFANLGLCLPSFLRKGVLLAMAALAVLAWGFGAHWLESESICPPPTGLEDLQFVPILPGVTNFGGPTRTVAEPFCISTTEISRRDWRSVLGEEPRRSKWPDRWPITDITLEEAREFVDKLAIRQPGVIYRLPDQGQWQLAAAAGAGGIDPSFSLGVSEEDLHHHGNCLNLLNRDGYDGPAPVGTFEANRFGLYDVHGNVAEWIEAEDPEGKGRHLRVGGSFESAPRNCRIGVESWIQPQRHFATGFRIVRELPAPPDDN